jgi:hypothetical protein
MSDIKASMKKAGQQAGNVGKNFANQGWASLPTWAKGVIFVGVGFGVYKLFKSLSGAIGKTKLNEDQRDAKQEVDGWYKSYEEDKAKKPPSMSVTQQKAFANKIWNAMDGYGTRDYDIKQAFKAIKTNADFSGVNKMYGTRTLQPGHGIGWAVSSFRGTMIQCLQDDASSTTLDAINKILAGNKVKYRV